MPPYEGPATFRHLVPLVADMVVSFDTLGSSHQVSLPGFQLELRLPGLKWANGEPQAEPPEGFKSVPGDEPPTWLHSTYNAQERSGQALLSTLALTAHASVTILSQGDERKGSDAPDYVVDLEAWVNSFERWISVIANQPLDSLRPRNALISPRSTGVVTWIDDQDGVRLVTKAGAGSIPVGVRGDGPVVWHDEVVVTPGVLAGAVARANAGDKPSVVADLWARAQHAITIKDYRTCLVDLGTIAEAALVQLDPSKQSDGTLGRKVQRIRRQGVALPEDIDYALVSLRNEVVHDAYLPTRTEAIRAGEIVERLAADVLAEIGFAAEAGGIPAHRPARADLTIFRPAD